MPLILPPQPKRGHLVIDNGTQKRQLQKLTPTASQPQCFGACRSSGLYPPSCERYLAARFAAFNCWRNKSKLRVDTGIIMIGFANANREIGGAVIEMVKHKSNPTTIAMTHQLLQFLMPYPHCQKKYVRSKFSFQPRPRTKRSPPADPPS